MSKSKTRGQAHRDYGYYAIALRRKIGAQVHENWWAV
jgi:hypothetical protein